jgi:hypothetical protein
MPTPPFNPLGDNVLITDQTKFENWLRKLWADEFGQALCINLYIDLNKRRLDMQDVASVINNMMFTNGDARLAFYEYIRDHQAELLFHHLDGPQSIEDDQYVRVLTIKDMITYYLHEPLKLHPELFEAEKEVQYKFYDAPLDERENLGVVEAAWTGNMAIVWVTSRSELETVISACKVAHEDPANTIRDRLGFSQLNDGQLVYIIYPEDFDRARVYMPTVLDANVGSLFYLSIASADGWGLSCCLHPHSPGLKERVHEAFTGGLTAEYEMKKIGEIKFPASPKFNHLVNEAIIRAQ